MEPASNGFRGTDRYQLVRLIGRGGMGVVYEAYDRKAARKVALKLLPNATPDRLLRFKREFRAAAELHHDNLVRLGELVGSEDVWFFTMELVVGTDIVSFVRGHEVESAESHSRRAELTDTSASDPNPPSSLATAVPLEAAEEQRLRSALAQLASGLAALHAAGSIHRDVKPSNVLVTREGRVVLLDFGLASLSSQDTTLFGAGTPLYMAPEQASGPVTAAADWYAFGVLMFELLTGSLPFRGAPHLVLLVKQGGVAPVVRARNSAAPLDLAEVCDALLKAEPGARLSGADVLSRLHSPSLVRLPFDTRRASKPPRDTAPPVAPAREALLGREREWQVLADVFAEVRKSERPRVLSVRGDSGIGKSTLAHGFAESLTAARTALVFSGRCHERELVPYKAIDDIFDALSHWLRHRRSQDVEPLLPRRAGVLARVFPVLARVHAIARADQPELAIDPQELRTLLFSAARELLINIARVQPLVLVIDDLHWADQDSLALLSDVFASEAKASILLLCTVRTSAGSRLPERLLSGQVDEHSLSLGALTSEASALLAAQLLRAADVVGVDAPRVGAESGGHPLFLRELVFQIATRAGRPDVLTLESMLRTRIESLSEPAVRTLRLCATAGAPRSIAVIEEAAELDAESMAQAVSELRSSGFLQVSTATEVELLDVSHDRVRQAARAGLSERDAQDQHKRLAEVLERRGDPAGSAVHWRETADPTRAAAHYVRAAEQASQALAFGDAIDHYAAALELGMWSDEQQRALRVKYADALSNAGRGRAAAAAYRSAAHGAEPGSGLELKRRAAGELMRSGYLDEGRLLSREVLSEAGMSFARLPLVGLVLRRIMMRLRGLGFRERAHSEAQARLLERIDLCWSLSTALVVTDHVQGAYLQVRGLLLALRSGDPARVARAIAAEAAFFAGYGARAQPRVYRLIDAADSVAARLGEPRLIGTVSLMAGIAAHLGGRFAEAKLHLERAEQLFRERCTGVVWESDACRQFWLESVFYLGELDTFPEAVAQTLKEAEDRGLMYALVNLRTGLPNAMWLIRDEPARAAEASETALRQWSGRGFHVQHWYQLMSGTQVELYLGDGAAAHRRIESAWSELSVAHLLRLSHTRIVATHLRARAALAAARNEPASSPARARLLKLARRAARRLESERAPWSSALAALVVAGAEALEGRTASSTRLGYLRGLLERSDLKLYALALDTAQDEHTSGGLARLGVKNPHAFARMLLPGMVG